MILLENQQLEGEHGRPILYDVHGPGDPRKAPVVIFSHGFKGFKDWGPFPLVAEAFAEAGSMSLRFNFSYNGGTVEQPVDFPDLEAFGQNNYSKEVDDLGTVIDAVAEGSILPEGADPENICLLGHSRGGGVSIIKAGEDPRVRKLVTWSAVSDLQQRIPTADVEQWRKEGVVHIPNSRTGQEMPMYYQFYEDLRKNRDRLDIQRAARKLSIPWLIVHGEQDETVPLQEAYHLKEWCSGARLEIFPETGHTLGGRHPWEKKALPGTMKKAVDLSVAHLLGNKDQK